METFSNRVTSNVKDNHVFPICWSHMIKIDVRRDGREEMYDATIIKCSALKGGWALKHEYTV